MKEFKLSPGMDRMPFASQPEEEQIVSVSQDQHLLNHLRRGLTCGCGGCKADAVNARERIRGMLPTDAISGAPLNPFVDARGQGPSSAPKKK